MLGHCVGCLGLVYDAGHQVGTRYSVLELGLVYYRPGDKILRT